MVLQKIEENKSWIKMTWAAAFEMRWPNILFIADKMKQTFENPEILAGKYGQPGQKISLTNNPEKQEMLVMRGRSIILKGMVSVGLNTDSNVATIIIPKTMGYSADYEVLSKACGQFMDSIELRMYAGR